MIHDTTMIDTVRLVMRIKLWKKDEQRLNVPVHFYVTPLKNVAGINP